MNSEQTEIINIIQGEYKYSSNENTVLTTVLGSCVACCLYDPDVRVGGMNHFLLPDGGNSGSSQLKYGLHAMEMLINDLLKSGASRSNLHAKIFGGAGITEAFARIGASNSAFALRFLEDENIPCVSKSVGGSNARRIRFTPTTGSAQQKIVAAEIVEEVPVKVSVPAAAASANIELF